MRGDGSPRAGEPGVGPTDCRRPRRCRSRPVRPARVAHDEVRVVDRDAANGAVLADGADHARGRPHVSRPAAGDRVRDRGRVGSTGPVAERTDPASRAGAVVADHRRVDHAQRAALGRVRRDRRARAVRGACERVDERGPRRIAVGPDACARRAITVGAVSCRPPSTHVSSTARRPRRTSMPPGWTAPTRAIVERDGVGASTHAGTSDWPASARSARATPAATCSAGLQVVSGTPTVLAVSMPSKVVPVRRGERDRRACRR